MTTASYTSRIRHDSDAVFREWAQELHDALVAVGCTQTADTGQINFTTVTRAGVNADAGYSIYYMNDSIHATEPCYFKIYWGTYAATDRPRIRIEIGTGSDGSGTITGGTTARIITSQAGSTFNTDTTYPTYVCMARGCLSVAWKVGRSATVYAHAGFIIARSCDNTGAADGGGWFVVYHNNSSGTTTAVVWQTYDAVNNAWTTTGGNYPFLLFPYLATSGSGSGYGDAQATVIFINIDRIRPIATLCGYATTDLTASNTVSLTTVGSTAFTFMAYERFLGGTVVNFQNSMNNHGILVVYE